jgi:hypothetical protein
MHRVAPRDLFSFCGTLIRAVGIAYGNCYECPNPAEFSNLKSTELGPDPKRPTGLSQRTTGRL